MILANKTDDSIVRAAAIAYIQLSDSLAALLEAGATKEDDYSISRAMNELQAVVESNGYLIGNSIANPLVNDEDN